MIDDHSLETLRAAIAAGTPLHQLVSMLRDFRRAGASRHEVQGALESLLGRVRDEETEDRILEVMDVVSGFCPQQFTVWD